MGSVAISTTWATERPRAENIIGAHRASEDAPGKSLAQINGKVLTTPPSPRLHQTAGYFATWKVAFRSPRGVVFSFGA